MERRRIPRVSKKDAVKFKWKNGGTHEAKGETKNISTGGVLLECEKAPEVGTEIELIVNVPPEITNAAAVRLLCKGKVLRAASNGSNRTAVAVRILSYEVLEEQ